MPFQHSAAFTVISTFPPCTAPTCCEVGSRQEDKERHAPHPVIFAKRKQLCCEGIPGDWAPLVKAEMSRASSKFSSVTQSCPTLCDPMNCSTPGLPVHHQLPESTQTHVHWVGDAIQPSHPPLSPSSPAVILSHHQGLFKWVRSSHQVAKVLEFQLQHQSFQWTPRPISFRMDWLDRLVVQGTLKSLLQHHNSKASILWCSTFFTVQLSPPYMTTGKTIALTRWTFVGKVMALLLICCLDWS